MAGGAGALQRAAGHQRGNAHRQVRETTLGAYAHQEVPFEKLVEELKPERDLSRTPLFQVSFTLNPATVEDGQSLPGGLSLRTVETQGATAKFDMTLSLAETGQGLAASLTYNTDLFEEATARRLLQHLGVLLEEVTARPETRISEVALLRGTEARRVLVEWNQTQADFPREATLHGLFEAQARKTPDAVALVSEEGTLTYRQVNEAADSLANKLRAWGVGPEVKVGLALERSAALVVAQVATLKAGGAWVPLDVEYPAERLGFMVEDSGAALVLVHAARAHELPSTSARVVSMEDALSAPALLAVSDRDESVTSAHAIAVEEALSPAEPPVREETRASVQADALAYVIYTSGSTGKPKGVGVEHRAVVNHLHWRQERFPMTGGDAFLAKASSSFDISVWEVWAPLVSGARLVLAKPGGQRDTEYLVQAVAQHGVTHVHFGPAPLGTFLDTEGVEGCEGLRYVFCGGEALSAGLHQRFVTKLGAKLVHQYGPTEACIDCVAWETPREPVDVVPLGRPIANTDVYVVDAAGRAVPVGVPGELLVGGEGLARGYLGRADLTAERFIPDGLSGRAGARLYRTGDKARWREDGTLEYLGRLDFQVKVRGYRIELGEVEAALLAHPHVREAVAQVREDVAGDKRLIAWFVAEDPKLEPGALRDFLRQRLPEYMLPSTLMPRDALPLTPNGKVDRKALRALAISQSVTSAYEAPVTPTEVALAAIWAELLRAPTVGRNDNFFDLGGHSLLATQVVARIRATLGVELPLSDFFLTPTVVALAERLDHAPLKTATPSITPSVHASAAPLSFAQQRLWFIDQLEPGSSLYNAPIGLTFSGTLDVGALRSSLDALMARHDALRTTFREDGGQPVQIIHAKLQVPFETVDLTNIPDAESRHAEALRLRQEEARRPFSLSKGPLMRALLLKLGAQEHQLVLNTHHIVSDGWSLGVMVREVTALYEGFLQGRPHALPALPMQYADFARWQREWLQGETLDAQISWWKDSLAGASGLLELPTDKPRPTVPGQAAGTVPVRISPELSEQVEALAKQEGVTPFMVWLAAFQTLLHRYSGQDDILVGSPIANRRHAETEGLIGFFANTLVLRARFGDVSTFRELLAQVRTTTLGAYEHQDLPFEKLVEVLQPERAPGRTPLFQVTFTLQNAPMPELKLPALTLRPLEDSPLLLPFDLQLLLTRIPEGYAGGLVYNAALFTHATVAGLGQRLRLLIKEATRAPRTRLSQLPLLTSVEHRQLLADWNGTAREYPRDASVPALFSEQAMRTPDAIALKAGTRTLTYAQLEAASNQLAHHLRWSGVRPGDRVGLCVERSPQLITAMLGILKAGAAYVAIDARDPAERITWIVQEAGLNVLVTQDALADSLPVVSGLLVLLDEEADRIAKQPVTPLQVTVPAQALAYVMFTSGSTGRPKGVSVPHRGILRLARDNGFLEVGPEDVFLQLAPVAFDASTLEIWGALLNGAKLVLAPPKTLSLAELGGLLGEEGINTLWLTAALFEQMVSQQGQDLARVRRILAGGDVLPVQAVREHLARLPEGAVLINGYGPTENTTFSATHTLRAGDTVERSVPIGRPLGNSTAWVLDKGLQPLPPGAPGELYVGGDGLAWGYLQRPDLTAERFIPHPFSREPGARLYRTGDRVRWTEDGTLEFLGRADFQVKIRGFRIEPGEVEAVLRQAPGVRETVVLAREDVPGDKRLVGYLVPSEGALELDAVKDFVAKQLPEYMVPSAWVELTALPLNANGKVDRKVLPAPEAPSATERRAQAPRNAMEASLAAIWAEVLHVEGVGIDDNFFDLGGHSLLATQVVARIRTTLGVELPLGDLFTAPTVATLAARLGHAVPTAHAAPLTRADRTSAPPLSFAQQRLWFIDQLDPGSSLYNVPMALKLVGALDVRALRGSIDALMARHEALRTTFRMEDGAPVQVIHAQLQVPFETVDLTDVPDAESRQAQAQRLRRQEARRPFNLGEGPLMRALLLKLGEQEHQLVLHLHHIVSDGWSLGVLIREVTTFYESLRLGRTPALPELPVQYADFAVWQRDWLQGKTLETQLSWWKDSLEGAPGVLELRTDRPRPNVLTPEGVTARVRIPRALSEQVEALAKQEGATPYMLLLAAFQTLLHRYSGQDDVLVGSPIANRRHAETEGLIGFFVNTLVLRARFGGVHTFRELLAQVRTTTLGAQEHQDVPFEKLVEELQPARDLGRTPFFQALFVLQNAPLPELTLPGLSLQPLETGTGSARFDLELSLLRTPEGFEGGLHYPSALFEPDTVARMARHLEALVEAMVASPGAPLKRFSLLNEVERKQVLVDWNATGGDYPREACIQDLFMAQAARTPDAVALEFGDTRLTYAQLDMRSNQWAHLLREHGVGPDVLVAVCLDRSVELIVSLLAILKAGGAYLPLDATYPAPRLTAMLEDAPPKLLLTTREVRAKLAVDDALPCLFVEEARLEQRPPSPVHAGTHSRHLAYVDFTSGSTGRPKGVATEHRGVLRLLHHASYVELGPKTAFLLISPISFDASTLEVWGPLLFGGRLVVFPASSPSDLALLEKTIQRHGVTTLFLTAGLFSQVVDLKPEALWGVRQVLTGGDVVSAPHVRRVVQELGIPVTAGYGPTETTVFASTHRMTDASQVGASVPIGRPIAETQLYVLDVHGQPQPAGVPGELFIGGDGLARGYLSRPDLTAERFVPNPFSPTPGERLYRTGDVARWTPEDVLEFLGRMDAQVKVRGFRIELAEVEVALRAHPAVRDAVALVRQDTPGDKRLVAYVAGVTDGPAVRAFVQQRLPEYMVPSAVVVLDALPLTANGKLDRKALPVPGATTPRTGFTAPSTPTQATLATLFAEVLGVERVGIMDNFFELGGHSLLATRLVARVRSSFGVELPLRALFEAPTVAALASRLESRPEPDGPQAPALIRAERPEVLPLSFAQQRLWFIDQLEPGSPLYNIPTALRLSGALDVSALQQAVDALVQRHESLRTTFETHEGDPRQRIHPAPSRTLRTVDLSALPEDAREAEAIRRASEDALRPFDLARGPLVRFTLLTLDARDHVLLLCLHHAIADGWSFGILIRELVALYEAFRQGQGSPLIPLPVQYADYALWQRSWLQGDVLDAEVTWWKQALSGAPMVLSLPTDKPRPAHRSSRGATLPVRLSPALSDAVEALAQREGATPFMVLLAALQTLLHRYTGQDDLLVGSSIAGRRHAETEGLIGFFVNTLVLRARFTPALSFRELVSQVRATTLGAYEHQDVPFEKLVEELQPARDLSRPPLIQVIFGLQNLPDTELRLPALTLRPVDVALATAKFELDLTLGRTPEGFKGLLAYSTDLFEADTARRLMEDWSLLLEEALAQPEAALDALPLPEAHGKQSGTPMPLVASRAPEEVPPRAPGLAAPRNGSEARLARLWAEALGVATVDPRDNFFELGGHSLLAVRLMAAVNRETGRRLPLSALFQAPSVERFAALLEQHTDAGTNSLLVPFDAGGTPGTAPPFFCVHPVGGTVLTYAALARRLGPEQRFYGLQSRGLDGASPPQRTLEAMATDYVRALREVQPAGPYHLGGWSLGGVIAYEMTRQLRDAGEEVALLALIDSYAQEPVPASEPLLDRTLTVSRFAQDLMGVALEDLELDLGALAALEPEAALTQVLESAARAGALPPGTDAANAVALFHVFEANLEASRRYRAPAMEQRVLRIQAEAQQDPTGTGEGGWRALVGRGLESHRLPGNHYTLLREPHVQRVAELLKQALRKPAKD
ncbi:MAG: amino acid adenylation domain-containing protein [Myxococcaceae bacterium]|nr:MAG: amino acid adenylation domain-containing protein [Myxococcaceae bacterium]